MKSIAIFLYLILILSVFSTAIPASADLLEQYCLVNSQWEKIFNKKNITVYSQKTPGTDVMAFKAGGILNASIEQIMEVLRKVEISEEWMPDIGQKIAIKEFSDLAAVTFSVNKLPWPFADREMMLHNELRLDSLRKYLVLDVYSVDSSNYPVGESNIRAHMYCGQTLIRPAGKEKTEIELILFLDPRGYIPAWLVNMAQKKMPYDFLRALEKKAAKTNFELRPAFQNLLVKLLGLLGQ
jgi:START domain